MLGHAERHHGPGRLHEGDWVVVSIDSYMVWTASHLGPKPEVHTLAVKASEGLGLGEYIEWLVEHQPDVVPTITRLGPVATPICVELRPAGKGRGWRL